MAQYWVNKSVGTTADHEVHKEGCAWMPAAQNRGYLGDFATCQPAVAEAKRQGYARANGCIHCAAACHVGS